MSGPLQPKAVKDAVDFVLKVPDIIKTGNEARKAPVGAIVMIIGLAVTFFVSKAIDSPDGIAWAGAVCIVLTIIAAVWASDKAGE